jgi:branched-chain amino acid transport system permease protein
VPGGLVELGKRIGARLSRKKEPNNTDGSAKPEPAE